MVSWHKLARGRLLVAWDMMQVFLVDGLDRTRTSVLELLFLPRDYWTMILARTCWRMHQTSFAIEKSISHNRSDILTRTRAALEAVVDSMHGMSCNWAPLASKGMFLNLHRMTGGRKP